MRTVLPDLVIRNLHASIDGAEILKGIDLDLSKGEVHAIMGPNGSGKSTLAHVLMGHPAYEVTAGEVTFKGENVLDLEPDERSRLGMFLAFQYPSAIPGVTVANFLRMAVNAHRQVRRRRARTRSASRSSESCSRRTWRSSRSIAP